MEPTRPSLSDLTPQQLDQFVDRLRSRRTDGGERIARQPRSGELPLSFAQERLWFLDQLEPGSPAYHLAAAVDLAGPLRPAALEAGLRRIVERHEALRTTFPAAGGQPRQRIAEGLVPHLARVDLSALPPARRAAEARRLESRLARLPFALAAGPLLRCALLRSGAAAHTLVLVLHHVVADGWSVGLIVREVAELYAAALAGRPPRLPELPLQYADFALWQRRRLAGDRLRAEVDHWRRTLEGSPRTLALPTDRPRAALRGWRGGRRPVRLSAETSAALERLAGRSRTTLFTVLLAGFAAWLGRVCGQRDLLVASPVANRGHREVEDLVGFFANTLVLRADVTGDPPFGALVERLGAVLADATSHQDLPFARLVEALEIDRGSGQPPLAQVMLTFDAEPVAPALLGVEARLRELDTASAKLDLLLALQRRSGAIEGYLEFSAQLFDAATAQAMAQQIGILLRSAAEEPDRRVSRLGLLSAAARAQLLHEWNDTAAPPAASTLHERVASQARRTPDAVALVAGGRHLSYAELTRRSSRLAAALRARGVGGEQRVAVLATRRPELVVALLAVLEAGAAYVPLDPAYPRRRLESMLADSGAVLLLTEARWADLLPEAATPRLLLDEAAAPAPAPPLAAAHSESLAYVIYTSGSTGRPKGVAIAHASAVALVDWALRAFPRDSLQWVLAGTSVCFDLSIFELFVPLACGGTVCLAEDALALPALPQAAAVTLVNTVPSAMRELVRAGAVPPSVRVVNLAGEPLPAALVADLHATASSPAVYNLYGPTEDTTYSTWARCAPAGGRSPTIGRPVDGTRAVLLDRAMQPVPRGSIGEVFLAGAGLARGYLGRPGATAERFVPDPFDAGGRLYRTGDLARHRRDGEIEFLGRADHQVKVRGFRIEPAEVEAALLAHPAVREAAVLPTGGGGAVDGLVAYLACAAGAPPAADELRRFLTDRLPAYMVPGAFVALAALPRTPNGKLDRGALPAAADATRLAAEHVAPRTPTEQAVAALWRELLEVERVGVDDDFFTLGGHSLLATRLVARLHEGFGIDLSLASLFGGSRLGELAAAVDEARRTAPCGDAERLAAGPRPARLPLSFSQERLWFLAALDGGAAYNMPGVLRLAGRLDPVALAAALGAVAARHEVLRTAFPAEDGRPYQAVRPPRPVALPRLDLTGLPPAAAATATAAALRAQAARPFDLAAAPPWRALLVRSRDDLHHLAITLHHVLADGWSLGLLLRDLAAAYRAALTERPPAWPALPVQYADFALWQRGWLSGERLAGLLAAWRSRLAGAPALELPADRPGQAGPRRPAGRVEAPLPRQVAERLFALAGEEKATAFMALLAVLAVLLHRYTGERDLVVGTPVANRRRRETEDLIGFFANTLVMRLGVEPGEGLRRLLGRVRVVVVDALAAQDMPFERLVEEVTPRRALDRSPLFDVLFAAQEAPPAPDLPGLRAELIDTPAVEAKLDLGLFAVEEAGEWRLVAEYRADRFESPRMARLLGHFATLAAAAAAAPETPVAWLPAMPSAEVRQVLAAGTGAAAPATPGVVRRFLDRAGRRPDAVAVALGPRQLTYRCLERRSARLAERLLELGAGPGVTVGLDLPRSPEQIVGLVAVLRAGAVCVPLDRSYPQARREQVLRDAGVRLVVGDAETRRGLAAGAARVVAVDARPETADAARRRDREPAGCEVVYVLYTSGSTGVPKGVALTHRTLANLVAWQVARSASGGPLRTLQLAPLGFDVSFQEIFSTLAGGGELVLVGEDERRDPFALLDVLARRDVERIFLPFVALQQIAEAVAAGGRRPESLVSIVTAGEQLRVGAAIVGWLGGLAEARLDNQYGPTETHVVSEHRLAPPAGRWPALPPIGRPLPGVRLFVLGPALEPQPVGVPGELFAGGVAPARGYLGRPGWTAERFVPDPFADGERLYRTGDLARWREDGELEFLGRLDAQVKVRGFRVEPGEVEARLVADAGVRDAVVVLRDDAPGGPALVAYLVPAADGVGTDRLRAGLAAALPEHMVPTAFVVLDRLPLTPSGKLDRRALPAVPAAPAAAAADRPASATEGVLASLLEDLLGGRAVSVGDDFFALGGHSLLATRYLARIREALRVDLPLRSVFALPTVRELAREVERLRLAGRPPMPAVERLPAGDRPPSFAQERLWFLDQFHPGAALYNLPAAVDLAGPLDVGRLSAALRRLVDRHSPLRTVLAEAAGRPVQRLVPSPVALPVVDLAGLPPASAAAEAARLEQAAARGPFDLARGPLWRVRLLRLAPAGHRLLLVLHHAVADAWSLQVIGRELARGLDAAAPEPPPLPVQYGDFAVWQRGWLSGEVLAGEIAWWRDRLRGPLPLLELPGDRPRPPVQTFRGGVRRRALPDGLAARVEQLARHSRTTPFVVLSTAFDVLLHRLSGLGDLVVGTPVANRRRPEVADLVGLFVNTVPLRVRLAAGEEGTALLARVRDVVLEAFDHQDLPFERLVEAVLEERDLSHTPVFQVLFGFHDDPAPVHRVGELSLAARELDTGTARFDLSVAAVRGGDGRLELSWGYNRDLFDAVTVDRFAACFRQVLEGLLEHPERPLGALALLDPVQRHQLLVEWNDSAAATAGADTVHGLVAARAARAPEAVAVVCGVLHLTHGELHRRSRRVAAAVRAAGVGPRRPVAVLADRSPEMVAALVGVLAAGCPYLPLDVAFPADRLAFMLEDSAAPLVLVSRALRPRLPATSARVLDLEQAFTSPAPPAPLPDRGGPRDLAYAIYTSGSTGRPKGVMVAHRNAVNFFAALDARLGIGEEDVLLAVTSISFDISVLELLWTLHRGVRVVIDAPEAPERSALPAVPATEVSLFYFASEEPAGAGDRYRLLVEGARFADRHGFTAVWTPERHFHDFGGLYPNPAVVGAALAAVTERVQIRAGSVVLPLQDPLRVAEEWSVVDNLSNGRVAVSFASGWHADDFVLAPDRYADRREVMLRGIETVRALWRGEAVTLTNGLGQPTAVTVHPRPVQPELPVWLTAAGSPDTFREAGRLGLNVLTHLLGQTAEELGDKVALYRQSRRAAGHPGDGHVTLMLHTFVGRDAEAVRRTVRGPFREYLRSSVGLIRNLAHSLGRDGAPEEWSAEEVEALLDHAFDRYFDTAALFGTVERCAAFAARLRRLGVDELACLIDFGVPVDESLAGLELLAELQQALRRPAAAAAPLPARMLRHGVTALQCTPSLAAMLVEEEGAAAALGGLRRLLVGGEALPRPLAERLGGLLGGELHNMYGPTETTVWSASARVRPEGPIVLGRPLGNTEVYVLDRGGAPLPAGVPGELHVAGDGVSDGYLGRPALTADRFRPDPFGRRPGGRAYRTGDLARLRHDGAVDFLGRLDHQVKVRGHRVELGEVEAALARHPAVREAVVVLRDGGAAGGRLVAYVVPRHAGEGPLRPLAAAAARLDGRPRVKLPNGLLVTTLDELLANQLYREIFENEVYLRHGLRLEPGASVFDIGANIGFFSLFVHHRAPGARVFAFEPVPATFEVLRLNQELYGVDTRVYPVGLSRREETAELIFYPRMAGLSGRYSRPDLDRRLTRSVVLQGLAAEHAGIELDSEELEAVLAERFVSERVACRLRPLSELIDETGVERIDYLKIDVERAELDVLAGIRDEHWPLIRQVGMEVDGADNLAAAVDILAAHGFAVAVEDLVIVPAAGDEAAVEVYMVYASRDGLTAEDRPVDAPVAVAAARPEPPSVAALRDHLAASLPESMLPSFFVVLDELPRTPNGKIDRRRLPAPEERPAATASPHVEPQSELERSLAALWRDLLGVERVGTSDNFFEIGGTSLLIAQMRTRLRHELGFDVSLVDLFRHSSVESLARHLSVGTTPSSALDETRRRSQKMKSVLRQSAPARRLVREES